MMMMMIIIKPLQPPPLPLLLLSLHDYYYYHQYYHYYYYYNHTLLAVIRGLRTERRQSTLHYYQLLFHERTVGTVRRFHSTPLRIPSLMPVGSAVLMVTQWPQPLKTSLSPAYSITKIRQDWLRLPMTILSHCGNKKLILNTLRLSQCCVLQFNLSDCPPETYTRHTSKSWQKTRLS